MKSNNTKESIKKNNHKSNSIDEIKKICKKISFKSEDNKLANMFSQDAKDLAHFLNNESSIVSTTQFRKFYEEILKLSEKGLGLEQKEFETTILPLVKLLISKAHYVKSRGHCQEGFVVFFEMSIEKVNSVHELQNFQLFLESIIGFMPKK